MHTKAKSSPLATTREEAHVQQLKPSAANILGFYEISVWRIHFLAYLYISVSVYDRERERGKLLKYLGGGRP